jgi:hypothetical protein
VGRVAVAEKGGDFVQKPIRYYITKSGEEPTVRSVKVALNTPDGDDRPERGATATNEPTVGPNEIPRPEVVTRLVKGVIRKRAPRQ